MVRSSVIFAENENCKVEILVKLDNKDKAGQNAGLTGSITNRFFEQLLEFFNCNELKVVAYAEEVKPEVKNGRSKKARQ